jgi:hypothetical protein
MVTGCYKTDTFFIISANGQDQTWNFSAKCQDQTRDL